MNWIYGVIFLFTLLDSVFNCFNKQNNLILLTSFTLWLFGFMLTLFMKLFAGLLMFIMFYDYIKKSYNVFKRTIKNVIQMEELQIQKENKSTEKMVNNDIDIIKQLENDIQWCENKINKCSEIYLKTKVCIFKYLEPYNDSTLKIDIDNIKNICTQCIMFGFKICFDVCESYCWIIEELPFIGKYLINSQKYVSTSIELYKNQDEELLSELKKSDVVEQLDNMNNLMDMMNPLMESMKNIQNVPFANTSLPNQMIDPKQLDAMMNDIFKGFQLDAKKSLPKKKGKK